MAFWGGSIIFISPVTRLLQLQLQLSDETKARVSEFGVGKWIQEVSGGPDAPGSEMWPAR